MSDRIATLDRLHPSFHPIAAKWLHIMHDDLGLSVKIVETLRTPERQAELKGQGASKVSVSWHQFGLAFDFAVFDDRGIYQTDDRLGIYLKGGKVGEVLGCVWGGGWQNFKDLGHLEHHPGFTMAQYQAALKSGEAML